MHSWMFENWLREYCVLGGRRLRAPLYSSARNLSALQSCLQHGMVCFHQFCIIRAENFPMEGRKAVLTLSETMSFFDFRFNSTVLSLLLVVSLWLSISKQLQQLGP